MQIEENKIIVQRLINEVWNEGHLEAADELLAPDYLDHSVPKTGIAGFKEWVKLSRTAFNPFQVIIDDQVTEADKSVVRITLRLTHTGVFRGIAPTGKTVETKGYRFYRLQEGKIVEQWALIDGQSLEKQLTTPEA